MIVRNESRVIERCLKSALPHIDTWCIVDTGSTDETKEIIRQTLQEKQGILHERPWRNFGENRTEAFELAKDSADWVLLLDADMVLMDQGFDTSQLDPKINGYRIWQGYEAFGYENIRLLRSDLPWRCLGVTHEYFTTGLPNEYDGIESLRTLAIHDIGDGGFKDDKFERDIRLLTDGLKKEPNNARYVFYLAQSYRDVGNHEKAVELYRQRSQMGGFEEEAWYATYQVGVGLDALGQHEEAITAYLAAYDRRPTRAEPLHACAVLARKLKRWGLALICARGAAMLPRPADILFVQEDVYRFRALDEMSIAAYWAGSMVEGQMAIMRLLQLPLSSADRERVLQNMSYYSESS